MIDKKLYALQYPIGEFQVPTTITSTDLAEHIKSIEELPYKIKSAVANLSEQQLDTPYRPDGWTIRQVIHHLADSHLNSYIRFKWALTEEMPIIKTYNEVAWAELPDAKSAPIDVSIKLLEALHDRWVIVLKNLSEADLRKYSFILIQMKSFVWILILLIMLGTQSIIWLI